MSEKADAGEVLDAIHAFGEARAVQYIYSRKPVEYTYLVFNNL